jgi:hypothetical protein
MDGNDTGEKWESEQDRPAERGHTRPEQAREVPELTSEKTTGDRWEADQAPEIEDEVTTADRWERDRGEELHATPTTGERWEASPGDVADQRTDVDEETAEVWERDQTAARRGERPDEDRMA